ncbi:MAG: hypothetical protein JO082_10230 [Mycobacterium sp.]|nr:hypothetical protein [Mycobacterium sp.]MBV9722283.1 hypothetical protein [Mycobacterium sp.]
MLAGACSAAATFLALGMTPLATAPAANADFGIDDLFDLIDPNLVASAVDPTGGLDLGTAAATSSAVTAQADNALAEAFQQDFWIPLHTALEDWINSPLGQDIDDAINPLFAFDNFCGLICNGAPGTAELPDGGNGGWFVGDGGPGWNSDVVGEDGGNGGDAGGWGDGGDGGYGGFGADGGAGGDGGEMFGDGGDGGAGGDGGFNDDYVIVAAGTGGAGGDTGNYQDFLGFEAAGNGGGGGPGGTGYDVDGGSGGPGGDGSAWLGIGGTGGPGGPADPGTAGGPGQGPTGEIGGPGGPGGTNDNL